MNFDRPNEYAGGELMDQRLCPECSFKVSNKRFDICEECTKKLNAFMEGLKSGTITRIEISSTCCEDWE